MKRIKNDIWIGGRLLVGSDEKSSLMIKVAIVSVAVSIAVMIIAVSVISGFKSRIGDKIAGFDAHIQIENLDNNKSYEKSPVEKLPQYLIEKLEKNPYVKSVGAYCYKPGLLRNGSDVHGIVLEGIDKNSDTDFFKGVIIKGSLPPIGTKERVKEIVISKRMADALLLDTGSMVETVFMQEPPRRDRFKVCGIYESSIAEFDELIALTDIRNTRRLNNWGDSMSSGYRIMLSDLDKLQECKKMVENEVYALPDQNLMVTDYIERNPAIFDWLDLQNVNGVVIIAIMMIVACFNISAMMLMIMVRSTRFIGIMKTIGTRNISLQRIFIYSASKITLKGIVLGDIIALLLLGIQHYTGVITLDSTGYFVSSVPVVISLWHVLAINVIAYLTIVITQMIPTMIISRFSPAESIKYKE